MAYAGHRNSNAAAPRGRRAPQPTRLVPTRPAGGFRTFTPTAVVAAGGTGLPIGADNRMPRAFSHPGFIRPTSPFIMPVGAGAGLPIGADNPVPFAQVPPTYALGDNGEDDYGQFGGFSLKGITKAIKKVASPVQKAAAAVGHTVGNVVTSKAGQAILGTGLALTGIGAPAAAGIFAATKGVGSLIKPGGNIKHALTGAAQGAVEGVASVYAGKAVRAIGGKILNRGGSVAGSAASTGAKVLESQVTGGGGANTGGGDVADTAAIADAQRQIAEAQAAAEQARAEAARQVAEAQAAAAAAQSQGNDAAARAAADAAAQLAAQRAAADAAAQAAAAASQSANGSTDSGQLQALIDAAKKAAQTAQAAAAAPPTPQATAAVQGMAQEATDATQDAVAGAPAEAGVLGSLTSNPLLLVGGLAVALLVFGKKRRNRRAA